MINLKIMNTKETIEKNGMLERQFGCEMKLEHGFAINTKNRVYAFNKEIFDAKIGSIRLNSLGVYFAEIANDEIRLSIEGSQIAGKRASKNVVELSEEEALRIFKGEDLEKETNCKGFVILKHDGDFLGTGKIKGNKILNFVSKARRINQN